MTESTPATDTLEPADTAGRALHRNTRVYQMLAWVGIVAGILFIVAVVFFSGFFAARATGGFGWHRGDQYGQMRSGTGMGAGMGGGCPMMQTKGGGMGAGGMPGMGPDGMAPGGPATPPPAPSTPVPPAGQR